MLTSIILAGGSSKRFGMDKSMLMFGDNILLGRVANEMAFADELLISVSTEENIIKYGILIEPPHTYVVDERKNEGALGGLLATARKAKGEFLAVAPCDAPFVSEKLYRLLHEQSNGHDGAAPRVDEHWEPLIAMYRKEPLIALLEKKLSDNNKRLSELCTKMDTVEVNRSILELNNIPLHTLLNINKPEDLENAVKMI
jgi:molybdopterin-guanine dinucleotide biosynthesis protein A